jgi:hypothetical protein
LVYDSGAVKKRFDKASKTNPAIILVLQEPEGQGEVARLTIKRLSSETGAIDASLRAAPANLMRSMFGVADAQWLHTIVSGGTVSLLSLEA